MRNRIDNELIRLDDDAINWIAHGIKVSGFQMLPLRDNAMGFTNGTSFIWRVFFDGIFHVKSLFVQINHLVRRNINADAEN